MSWRRFPTFLPNFPLKLIPLTEAQQTIYEKTGFLKDLAFKTVPQANKVCVEKEINNNIFVTIAAVATLFTIQTPCTSWKRSVHSLHDFKYSKEKHGSIK